jgi:hypothetical protein
VLEAGVDEEELAGVVLVLAAAFLGAMMRNHTIAKMMPRMRRITRTIRKIASGLLVNQS